MDHRAKRKEAPFFLYLSLTSPHTPIAPSEPFLGKSGVSPFADYVIETDWVVGQVMEALEAAGTADEFLLIFTTDNGIAASARFPQLKKHGVDLQHHLTGNKGQIQEGGHRVPFIARWPGKIVPGSNCREVICLNDFMATVAEILEFPLPDNATEDSTSILPLLTGEESFLPSRPMVVNHDYNGNFDIRDGKWKLVGAKLFNLETDLKETTDVATQHPEIAARMAKTLETYRQNGRSTALRPQNR